MSDFNTREERIKKLDKLREKGIQPYPAKYDKQNNSAEILAMPLGTQVKTAGRLVLFRAMGKLAFGQLQDFYGRIQIVLNVNELDKEDFKIFEKLINVGDFVGVEGEVFKTKKGEISILVKKYQLLGKALRDLPEKFHGLKDKEIMYRQRYLDLIMNEETRDRFKFRSDFIYELRSFYHDNGFIEIETPVLGTTASGALAKPFVTHHNALDIDVYLRIAPELYLKEAIIGGYEKIFEIARCFRNEGIDPSHLQDFTMVEHYSAYWDFEDNMKFTEKMLTTIIQKLKNNLKLPVLNREGNEIEVDFSGPWPVVSFRDLILQDCGIDIDKYAKVEELRAEIKAKKIDIEEIDKLGRGNLIDELYKVVSRPKLINPTFLIKHPLDLSPLARTNDENPLIVDRFQLVVNGWEIVNAYSELVDPIDQLKRFEEQAQAKEHGDEDAMNKDLEYVKAMEYGMPPISGWGMGIDRIVSLLTCQPNLKDVVLFPLMKPEEKED